jgi:hypothetical protein
VVQVENEELLYGTGTGHFAGFFSYEQHNPILLSLNNKPMIR